MTNTILFVAAAQSHASKSKSAPHFCVPPAPLLHVHEAVSPALQLPPGDVVVVEWLLLHADRSEMQSAAYAALVDCDAI